MDCDTKKFLEASEEMLKGAEDLIAVIDEKEFKPKKIGCVGHDCDECKKRLEVSPDSNVEKNREMLLQRSRLGLKKYGCTTEALTLRETLRHALEEALDLANYLQQAISEIDKNEHQNPKA